MIPDVDCLNNTPYFSSIDVIIRYDKYIHKTTITSFAIALSGQCCRRHVVGQRVVIEVSVGLVCSSWSKPICSLCSGSDNANLLLR